MRTSTLQEKCYNYDGTWSGVHLQVQHNPAFVLCFGKANTSPLNFQSPRTSTRAPLHNGGFCQAFLLQSLFNHALPSCLSGGFAPKASHVKDHVTTSIISIHVLYVTCLWFAHVSGKRKIFHRPPSPGKFSERQSMLALRSQLQGTPSPQIPTAARDSCN